MKRGGGAKIVNEFCHCCDLTSKHVVSHRTDDPCLRCSSRRLTNKCLHRKVLDKSTKATMVEAAKSLIGEHPSVAGVEGSAMGLFTGKADVLTNEALVVEERHRRLSSVGSAEDLGDDELSALVEEAILCILHLENRCSEKLFKLVLQEMVNRCKTDAEVRASAKQVDHFPTATS